MKQSEKLKQKIQKLEKEYFALREKAVAIVAEINATERLLKQARKEEKA
jgi:ribosomal protein L29